MPLIPAEGGSITLDGGLFADRAGDVEVEVVPPDPFIDVCIFSGRFSLLILGPLHV
jgi:hypothetical protein